MSQGCGSLASRGAMSLWFWAVPCPLLSTLTASTASPELTLCPGQGRLGTRGSSSSSPLPPAVPACAIKGDALEQ